jgi:hypothetical protein
MSFELAFRMACWRVVSHIKEVERRAEKNARWV